MGAGQSRIENYFQQRRRDENSRENLSDGISEGKSLLNISRT